MDIITYPSSSRTKDPDMSLAEASGMNVTVAWWHICMAQVAAWLLGTNMVLDG